MCVCAVCVYILNFGKNPYKNPLSGDLSHTASELCMTQAWHVNDFLTECVTNVDLSNGIHAMSMSKSMHIVSIETGVGFLSLYKSGTFVKSSKLFVMLWQYRQFEAKRKTNCTVEKLMQQRTFIILGFIRKIHILIIIYCAGVSFY